MPVSFPKFDIFEDSRRAEVVAKALLIVLVPTLGVVAGLVASTGNWKALALIAVGMVGIVLAMLPRVIFWITVVTSLLFVGLARMYLPAAEGIRWLVPLAAWLLAAYALADIYHRRVTGLAQASPRPVPSLMLWAYAFVVVILISSLLHWPGADTFAKGMKGYFQMWGLLFALAFYPWPPQMIERLPRFFLIAALFQIPFVMHQYLFLVPMRASLGDGVVAVDIISGTFGGQIYGGGSNAVLSTFLMIVFAGLLACWRQGVMSLSVVLPVGLVLLVPVALNVSKISIVYALVVFVVLFRRDLLVTPKRFFGMTLVFAGVIAILASAYTAFAPKELDTWQDLVEFTYEGNIERDTTNDGDLTRSGALRYWIDNQNMETLPETLFGYGPGATRAEDAGGTGQVDTGPVHPELEIGRLAITAMLWEGGLLSIVCIFGLFGSAFLAAGRLANQCTGNGVRRAAFEAIQVGVAVMFVSLWHKNFFVFHVPYQTIFALMFGYLAYWLRHGQDFSGKPGDAVGG